MSLREIRSFLCQSLKCCLSFGFGEWGGEWLGWMPGNRTDREEREVSECGASRRRAERKHGPKPLALGVSG